MRGKNPPATVLFLTIVRLPNFVLQKYFVSVSESLYLCYTLIITLKTEIVMITNGKNNYCVIMAGGIGSRFWPRSNKRLPKQFLDFLGSGRTLLQTTYDRFSKIIPSEHIFVVTNAGYGDIVSQQLPGLPPENILKEPANRNTAPAVAWAAYHLRALNPEACMVVTPTDQYILKEDEFAEAILRGLDYVSHVNHLLTVGIRATYPETNYGYIQVDEELEGNIYRVKSFTEKPELDFAEFFVESGEFYWNSGLFLWNVNAILEAMMHLVPDIAQLIAEADAAPSFLKNEQEYVERIYASSPNISLDYGVLEKSEHVDVLIGDFGWRDIGGWSTLYEMAPKDHAQNVVLETRALMYNCKNNLVSLPGNRVVAMKDLDGYLVVEENGVLLICRRDDVAAVRQFRNDVQMKMGDEYL